MKFSPDMKANLSNSKENYYFELPNVEISSLRMWPDIGPNNNSDNNSQTEVTILFYQLS